jgi:hypothetical protein
LKVLLAPIGRARSDVTRKKDVITTCIGCILQSNNPSRPALRAKKHRNSPHMDEPSIQSTVERVFGTHSNLGKREMAWTSSVIDISMACNVSWLEKCYPCARDEMPFKRE